MADKDLLITLGKVIIAAAWADGKISMEEVNCLKDILFRMPHVNSDQEMQLTAREWARLEIYIESPVEESERIRLVEELRSQLRTPRDRELVYATLDELIKADGVVTEDELAVEQEIRQALDDVNLGLIGQLGRLFKGPIERRSEAVAHVPNREHYFEDYIRNKVYYKVQQRLHLATDTFSNISDEALRKLSLAGGLMARVANIDAIVTDEEFASMVQALQTGWHIPANEAALVAEIAVNEVSADLDYYRLVREFFTATTEEERVAFLDSLFAVAAADGDISSQESVEIRHIGRNMGLTQQQFVDAKLKFSQ